MGGPLRMFILSPFRELNPRKGTETPGQLANEVFSVWLSANLIPERGLKQPNTNRQP